MTSVLHSRWLTGVGGTQVDVFDAAGAQLAALSSEYQTAISPRNVVHPRLPLLAAATASGRVHLYS